MSGIFGNSLEVSALTKDPSWKRSLEKVMREPGGPKLVELIHATELALFYRWQELAGDGPAQEREAMQQAAANLRSLQSHRLGWPDWS
jgi:hypothetical protein